MTTTTTHYGLHLYSEVGDASGSFIDFRMNLAGDVDAAGSGSSNMVKIDNALYDLAVSASALSVSVTTLSGSVSALGTWTAYTPVWTTDSTPAPDIGNGSITGKYSVVGRTCICKIKLLVGSTTTFGTGIFRISLPITAAASQGGEVGSVKIFDSGTGWYDYNAILVNTSNIYIPPIAATVPITFTTNDYILVTIIYETA